MITPEEIKKIISEILQNGVTLNVWSYVILGVFVFIASYLGGYIRRKGENSATKEDIKVITDKMESVKHEYAKELHIHQIRYEKEFEILSELSDKIISLRDAALSLRPILHFIPPKGKEEEWKQKRLENFDKSARDFYSLYERKKAFYPEIIYHSLIRLNKIAWKEATEFSLWSTNPDDRRNFDPKYWENAQKNSGEISKISDEVIEEIRKRIKKWETLDFEK